MSNSQELHQKIISVKDFLSVPSLTIPEYQRPYKWTAENVVSLFDDIRMHSDKPAYRLGTVVLHNNTEKGVLDIVDGQQRTLTLMLALLAINTYCNNNKASDDAKSIDRVLGNLPQKVQAFINKPQFKDDFSLYNLYENYKVISNIINRGDFTLKHIEFLLTRCDVVIFVLDKESEAFQFFDSQNSRGKDLFPHDLLKAFHLREFKTDDNALRKKTVDYWENLDDDRLAKLFSNHLYRIRRWSRGQSAQTFTKDDVAEFKGITLEAKTLPPYTRRLAITHHYIDDYNNSVHCKIAGKPTAYPFSIDQTIINGRRFFEMVAHYDALITKYKAINNDQTSDSKQIVTLFDHALNNRASKIINTLDSYNDYQRRRKGDKLTRNVFDNALIYYIDKFGTEELSQAVELLFAWAYNVRLTNYGVGLSTIDNHASKNTGMFMRINEAILPKNVVITSIPSLKISELANNHKPNNDTNKSDSDIYTLFNCLNYIDTSGE
ncbi:DUF262 domain-containing protein [Psychrobacter cryohalolentis]|uniref:Uncharacterized protein n=1 Tax=Psychrobacter cryohalolentis (strain ATCC BAA-1226 / DSM 17306 / VKM B-2378 / K5) TaxID=335284 RepID=Q1QC72_PSYCK|nr:DUF262 domain-containing protein [Psychrobacter cryohalolentis]ABE74731.1 protein of unknown function DUF262 [Psychrobacter cryohalolentis K5]ASE27343.1 DUF262 domain-containing protein [Psychrobacter cryohalolentis]